MKENYFELAADLSVNQFLIQLLNHVNLYTSLKTIQIDARARKFAQGLLEDSGETHMGKNAIFQIHC